MGFANAAHTAPFPGVLPFEKDPRDPGWHYQTHHSTWDFPSCTTRPPASSTNICCQTQKQKNLRKRFFPDASGTHNHCRGAQHGNPSTVQDHRGWKPPSGHSSPHPWDSPELALLGIFDHCLGQVLLLLLFVGDSTAQYEEPPAQAAGRVSVLMGRHQQQH